MYTVDGFIFVGTNFRGLNKNDTFVGFKIRGHSIFVHNSYRKVPFRGYWNSWIGPSKKTTKIGTPQNLSHPQYVILKSGHYQIMHIDMYNISAIYPLVSSALVYAII